MLHRFTSRALFGAALAVLVAPACGGSAAVADLGPASGALESEHEATRLRLLDDYATWLGPYRLPMRRGAAEIVVPAEVGWCYAYFGVGGAGVRDLDIVVSDSSGRPLGADTMFDVTPFVQHCADRSEDVTVQVTVARGSGEASFSVLRKPD